jgi:EpsI family protein
LRANRVVIELGGRRQLVYYWFQQRGRVMTNEYLVKWNLFLDGLMRNRSDGALVRVIMPIPDGSSVDAADREVVEFIRGAVPLLDPYVPL